MLDGVLCAFLQAKSSGGGEERNENPRQRFWPKSLIHMEVSCQNLPAHTPAGPRRTLPGRANALPIRG